MPVIVPFLGSNDYTVPTYYTPRSILDHLRSKKHACV